MKPVLTAILTITLVSLLAGAGTFAQFSDSETTSGNTLVAGTFAIDLNPVNSLPFKAFNIAPGWSHVETHGVENKGTLAGEIYLTAESFLGPEIFYGGDYAELTEPEPSTDVTPEDFAKVLYMKVEVELYDSDNVNNVKNYETELYDGPLYGMITDPFPIAPGQYLECKFTGYLPNDLDDPLTVDVNEDDNLYQADGVSAEIIFYGTTEITIDS